MKELSVSEDRRPPSRSVPSTTYKLVTDHHRFCSKLVRMHRDWRTCCTRALFAREGSIIVSLPAFALCLATYRRSDNSSQQFQACPKPDCGAASLYCRRRVGLMRALFATSSSCYWSDSRLIHDPRLLLTLQSSHVSLRPWHSSKMCLVGGTNRLSRRILQDQHPQS